MITLIGLAAKEPILIVDMQRLPWQGRGTYWHLPLKRWEPAFADLLSWLRLAFIFGRHAIRCCYGRSELLPRKTMVSPGVLEVMIEPSSIAILFVPGCLWWSIRSAYGKKKLEYLVEHHAELMAVPGTVEDEAVVSGITIMCNNYAERGYIPICNNNGERNRR